MRFVVLKFGGTSVSTVPRWRTIAAQAMARHADGARPVVVCSALSGVTNLLEQVVATAPAGDHGPHLRAIVDRHDALAQQMGVDPVVLAADFDEIERFALGASLVREVSPRVHARISGMGEVLATRLGTAFLRSIGVDAHWLDARELLVAEPEPNAPEARRFLSAACRCAPDDALIERLSGLPSAVLVTQGFIASDPSGATVLLGRGGSDTSGAYLAAKLRAERCEIWTDVPGMYTANPRQVREARLLRRLHYDEAQEIASMGAKVLHPRCVPPCREYGIPLHIRWTDQPDVEGTVISGEVHGGGPQVKAISSRNALTLVSMETPMMWQQVGFLADVFATFKRHGLSIDLVSTSESNVTVSLDPTANALDPSVLEALVADLRPLCEARTIGPCAAVSLVGRGIRGLLHRLGPALEVFEEQRVHLVSQAASDLDLTFVVDDDQADRLVQALHALLFAHTVDPLFGPPLFGPPPAAPAGAWWVDRRAELLAIAAQGTPRYVYDLATVEARATAVKSLSVDRVFYAMKANPHGPVLDRLASLGIGFECVSPGEVRRALERVSPDRVLFTPNFAPRSEYALAFEQGVRVTLDNLHPLVEWPDVFRGREVFVRLDPGFGHGHHAHVHTGGQASKFGIHEGEIDALLAAAERVGAHIVGLHAHVGSGIRTADAWAGAAAFLTKVAARIPTVRVLDLGGGLGVVERPGQHPLDLASLDAVLRAHRKEGLELWLEPGRYLVAEAGVLLCRVTQTKQKGAAAYVGVDAGMNSLIRPALYGAWHGIANLTRLDEPATTVVDVVGPICESGDVLGHERALPECVEGDVLLVATAGAYGHSMGSHYNLRAPADELAI